MATSPNTDLVSWPYSKFGTPLRDPDLSVDDPAARNEMDMGHKARQRYINPVFRGNYRVLMTNEVYRHFQAWHQHKISNGTEWFNFKVRSGDDMSWEEVRMTGMYQPSQQAKHVLIAFSIIQRTNNIPTETALDTFLNA